MNKRGRTHLFEFGGSLHHIHQMQPAKTIPFKKGLSSTQDRLADRALNAELTSLPLHLKRVLLDLKDGLNGSQLVKMFPSKSAFRVEFFALLLHRLKRATDQDLMDSFGLSRTMVSRIRHFNFARSFLLRCRYPIGTRRRRIAQSLIDRAIELINILVPIRSGKGFRLLTWDFQELFDRYQRLAVNIYG